MKKDTIPFTDFMKVDLRVGEVKECIKVEGSNKLLLLTVDLGEDYGTVEIFTGMAKFHEPEKFIGKKFGFIANLEPRQMMGKTSQGMLLAVDVNGTPSLIEIDQTVANGSPLI